MVPADRPDRAAFIARLNERLPRKRVIAQGLLRDAAGAICVCELTYKDDWDLPGGVVDPHESPATALRREIAEELRLYRTPGDLVLIDWLPAYRQWDDALLCLFDLGIVSDRERAAIVADPGEIRAVHWLPPHLISDHLAPYAARLVAAGVALLDGSDGPRTPGYLEDGRPVGGL